MLSEYQQMEKPISFSGKNRFLVMARVSDRSLHKEWLKPKKYKNFDFFLEYYGDGSNDFRSDADFYTKGKETKWPRLYKVMKEYGEEIFKYDAIWIPDDDISTDCHEINKMFELFMKYQLSLAQPALTTDSYYSHKITLVKKKYKLRYTNFVEVMIPLFSSEALRLCWETFEKSPSGWGLDSIWPVILGGPNQKIAIIDQYPMKHTRPVGSGTLYKDIENSPYADLKQLCKEYNLSIPFDYQIYGKVFSDVSKEKKSFGFKSTKK